MPSTCTLVSVTDCLNGSIILTLCTDMEPVQLPSHPRLNMVRILLGLPHTLLQGELLPVLQTEELQLLCSLGREAAEILWEMAALQDETEATKEMLEKGELLQVALLGKTSLSLWPLTGSVPALGGEQGRQDFTAGATAWHDR